MGQVWGLALPRAAKWILMSMADHSDHEGENCHAGTGLLAWKTDYDERTIERTIADLLKRGILIHTGTHESGKQIYSIDLSKAPRKPKYTGRKKRRTRAELGGGTMPLPGYGATPLPSLPENVAGGAANSGLGGGKFDDTYKEYGTVLEPSFNHPRAHDSGDTETDAGDTEFINEESIEDFEPTEAERAAVFAATLEFVTSSNPTWTERERVGEFRVWMAKWCERTAAGDFEREVRLSRTAAAIHVALRPQVAEVSL